MFNTSSKYIIMCKYVCECILYKQRNIYSQPGLMRTVFSKSNKCIFVLLITCFLHMLRECNLHHLISRSVLYRTDCL